MNTPLISRALQRRAWLLHCAWPTGCASTQTRDHRAIRAHAALRIGITHYGGSGVAGMPFCALSNQILSTVNDAAHDVAGVAAQRRLCAGGPNGLLHGPRLPMYGRK